ncbi:MAG TPA: alpha/beta fold hydrolase [Burkholderiaceae bacterium]|nr:alpha/beta fold hydrolase [Burkholderiaceae bacterium]
MLTDHFIDVASIKTRYWQAGSNGSAVLLLHGIGCSVLEWERNIEALAARHRVFALDLLGFGLTEKPANETYSLRRLAQFVLDFMTAKAIPQAHIAGNSLGGRLALECAAIAAQRVASLLLVDPAGMQQRETLFEFRLATLPLLGEVFTWPNRLGTKMLWRKAFAAPSAFVTEELIAGKVALARQPGAQAAFLKTLRGFLDFRGFLPGPVAELHAALPGIQAPTLVVWGSEDRFVPPVHAEVLRRALPNAEVQIWDRCGHAPQIECAQRFNEVALGFWRQLDLRLTDSER